MIVAHGCCVGSWDRFDAYVLPSAAGRPVTSLSGQNAIALAYNLILATWADQGVEMGILQHDDLQIMHPEEAVNEFARAFEADPELALLGVAGGSARTGLGWWNADPVGWQRTDARDIDFGQRTGRVDLLEGSLLVFNAWAIKNLRFTERMGFHGYDEVAYKCQRLDGRHAAVVDVATHHHTALGFDNEASHADWLHADRWFRQRWGIGQ